jgi:hypothetical protein
MFTAVAQKDLAEVEKYFDEHPEQTHVAAVEITFTKDKP